VKSNRALDASIRPVTGRARKKARPAAVQSSRQRERYADRRMSLTVATLSGATLVLSLGSSCVRNVAADRPGGECEVHHVRLETATVPLDYGLPSLPSQSYAAAYEAEFPHAQRSANGGCNVNHFYKWARVRACPRCNKAEEEWIKKHPNDLYEHDRLLAPATRTPVVSSKLSDGRITLP